MSDSGRHPNRVPLGSTQWVERIEPVMIDFKRWESVFEKAFTPELQREIQLCFNAFQIIIGSDAPYVTETELDRRIKKLAKDGDNSGDEDAKRYLRRRRLIGETGDPKMPTNRPTQIADYHALKAYESLERAGFKVKLSVRRDGDEDPTPVERFLIDLFFPSWGTDPSGIKKLHRALKKQ